MLKNRTLPALLLVGLLAGPIEAQQEPAAADAAPAASPATREPTEAEKALDEAIAKVEAIKSVTATLHQEGRLLGQAFSLSGKYAKDVNNQLYMLVELTGLGNATGRVLQVSDGQVYWELKQILQGSEIRRFALEPIFDKLNNPDVDEELRERVLMVLGFGGPESLLRGLRKSIGFNTIERVDVDGKPMIVIRGPWQDYDSLTSPGQPKLSPTAAVPAYVPSRAALWLGADDGWPYRLELYTLGESILEKQRDLREIGPDGRPLGPPVPIDPAARPVIKLTYSDVKINTEIGAEQFAFQPPEGVQVIDGTVELVQDLTRAIMQREAERKAEAAKLGPDLPSIPVPRPGDDQTPPRVESLPPLEAPPAP